MSNPIKISPETEHDWTVHSINIHGVFFERWCQQTISKCGDWKLEATNYPVEYPPPNGPWRGKESTLDIETSLTRGELLVTLFIECKKNNPDFIHWVFFPKPNNRIPGPNPHVIREIQNVPNDPPVPGWSVTGGLKTLSTSLLVADEARETRGTYLEYQGGNKTKTSNAAISDAANQIALATQAIALERGEHSKVLGRATRSTSPPPQMGWNRQVFLPMIVTTARLFACEFDSSEVDAISGEIPFSKCTLSEREWLLFQYALPRALQVQPASVVDVLTTGSLEPFMRMDILVVHSGSFLKILHNLATASDQF